MLPVGLEREGQLFLQFIGQLRDSAQRLGITRGANASKKGGGKGGRRRSFFLVHALRGDQQALSGAHGPRLALAPDGSCRATRTHVSECGIMAAGRTRGGSPNARHRATGLSRLPCSRSRWTQATPVPEEGTRSTGEDIGVHSVSFGSCPLAGSRGMGSGQPRGYDQRVPDGGNDGGNRSKCARGYMFLA